MNTNIDTIVTKVMLVLGTLTFCLVGSYLVRLYKTSLPKLWILVMTFSLALFYSTVTTVVSYKNNFLSGLALVVTSTSLFLFTRVLMKAHKFTPQYSQTQSLKGVKQWLIYIPIVLIALPGILYGLSMVAHAIQNSR